VCIIALWISGRTTLAAADLPIDWEEINFLVSAAVRRKGRACRQQTFSLYLSGYLGPFHRSSKFSGLAAGAECIDLIYARCRERE
jgi:hypothetical protein